MEVTSEATDTSAAVVTLDGSGSFDADSGGSIVQYRWEVVTDAYQWLELEQDSIQSPTATFEVPPDKLAANLGYSIEFRLTVTDNGRPAATDSDVVVFRINQAPVVSIEVTAKLFDRDDEPGVDDNRNGMVDENEERYSIEGVIRRPGEQGNAANEWTVRAATLLVIDGSASYDPDGRLSDERFSWELMALWGSPAVARSLPIGVAGESLEGRPTLSTDEEPHVPASSRSETVARLPFERGVGTEPFLVWYRLTVTDDDGASAREIVKIVFEDFHDHPEVEILRPESNLEAASFDDRYEGVLAAGEDRYVISTQAAEDGVALFAEGQGDGAVRTRLLEHTWSGAGVEPAESNQPGARSEAQFIAPDGAAEGDTFTAAVEVVDPDGLRASASVELVIADNTAPSAIAPDDIDTPDGIDGGFPVSDPPTGIVRLRGIGFDADGDELAYQWEQVANSSGTELTARYRGPRLSLAGADTPDTSFKLPEVTRGDRETVYVQLTVTDVWGVYDSDVVQITIRDGDDDLKARAGPDQQVAPGSFVRLVGGFSSGLVSADAFDRVTHQWTYRGIETDPPAELRPPISPREAEQGFSGGGWLPDRDGVYDPTAGGRLRNPVGPFAYFDAPELHDFDAVRLSFDFTVSYLQVTHTDTVAVTVHTASGLKYYSGAIGSRDHCTNLSLGGPPTRPFDSDGDGVADTCALEGTRRAAIARRLALEQLAALNPDAYKDALFGPSDNPAAGACASVPVDLGDSEQDLSGDVCARSAQGAGFDRAAPPLPQPVDPTMARRFYSGAIGGPYFCANHSLGGPTTYPFDHDGDGIADVCALAHTRREAVARYSALEAAFAGHPQFVAALAVACTALGTLDFGDPPRPLGPRRLQPRPPPAQGRPPPHPPLTPSAAALSAAAVAARGPICHVWSLRSLCV